LSVSILIPAFRPTFLRQTIASALTQGLEDFELIISDDSGGEEILPIVERFRDPRIRYMRTPGRIGGSANCQALWDQAARERVPFLLDDDLLMPHAIVELSAQLDDHPKAAFSFGQRFEIDIHGRIKGRPSTLPSSTVLLDHLGALRSLLTKLKNPFGELSNMLINRAAGSHIDDIRLYRGYPVQVMGDMAFVINASRRGLIVGIDAVAAAYRRHERQMSVPEFNPRVWAAIPEWELFLRGEYASGELPQEVAESAVATIGLGYENWQATCPALRIMMPGQQRLAESIARGDRDVLTDEFRADLDRLIQSLPGPQFD
jgi:glycosyltransferase involved in cell wall biosynthesis